MNNVKIKSLSFQGRRETNQDSFLEINPDNENFVFIAVADGMGGVAGGEKASHTVIDCCEKIIREKFKEDKTPDLKQTLRKIFFETQKRIKEEIQKDPELNGMGTTLACVLIHGDNFVWGNLGDSRIYYYTNSQLNLITKDHTHIQEFIDENNGPLTQSMIDNYGNFLTRSIDGGTDEPDIFPEDSEFNTLKDGEAFLLCSDGLIHNKAVDNTSLLEKFIIGTKNIEEAATKLKDMAFESGSTDNITIVLLEKGKIKRKKISHLGKQITTPKKIQHKQVSKKHYNKVSAILGIMLTIVVLSIFLIFFNNSKSNRPDISTPLIEMNSNKQLKIDENQYPESVQNDKDGKLIYNDEEENQESIRSGLLENNRVQLDLDNLKKTNNTDLVMTPNVTGKSLTEGIEELNEFEFNVIQIDSLRVARTKKGIIFYQSIKSGEKVKKGSKIKLKIAK